MRFFLTKPYLIAVAIVVTTSCGAIAAKHAFAGEAPDAVTQMLVDSVRDRQKDITTVKADISEEEKRHAEAMDPLNTKLDQLKNANAFDVGRINERGWTINWSTLQPMKLDPQ